MDLSYRRLISVTVFLVAGILFFDNNCFLKAPLHTIVKNKNIEYSAGQNKLYPTFFLLDESGGKYKVPGWLHGFVNTGDSLLVTRSVLFNKAIRIGYHKEGGIHHKRYWGTQRRLVWKGLSLVLYASLYHCPAFL